MNNNQFINWKNNKIIFFILYITLIFGFYYNENIAGGAIHDFNYHLNLISSFKSNFYNTLLNYKNFNTDHSPFYFIFLNLINLFVESTEALRFIYLHICLLAPLILYKVLIEIYNDCDKEILFLISCVILLSPFFRSYAIWAGELNIVLIFLVSSIYFFLKLIKESNNKKKYIYIFLNVLCFAIAAYFRPINCLISIYFFYKIFIKFKISKELMFFIFVNILLAFPAFYYVFILENIFFNLFINYFYNPTIMLYSNNILIISTIFLFYSVPFLHMNKSIILKEYFILNKKNIFLILITVILTFFLISNFNYNFLSDNIGGGIFYKISNYFFYNNILFYIICFFSMNFLLKIIFEKNINDIILILIIIGLDPDVFIFHMTYDPLLLCLFLLLFENKIFRCLNKRNQKSFAKFIIIYSAGIFIIFSLKGILIN